MKARKFKFVTIAIVCYGIATSIIPSFFHGSKGAVEPIIRSAIAAETNQQLSNADLLAEFRSTDPYLIDTNQKYFAHNQWQSLNKALYGGYIRLTTNSAPAAGFISKIYDGKLGNLTTGFPGSFLLFHGRKAEIIFEKPIHRDPIESISFRVIEFSDEELISPTLTHKDCNGNSKQVLLTRKVIETKGTVNFSKYSSKMATKDNQCSSFLIEVHSQSPDTIFMDEITIDNLGEKSSPIIEPCPKYLDEWKKTFGDKEFKRIESELNGRKTTPPAEMFKILLGNPVQGFTNRLIQLSHSQSPKLGLTLYSFIIQADNTGNHYIDLIRGWLLVPDKVIGPLPVLLFNHHGDRFASKGPLGTIGETEIAVATELATNNVAVLAIDGYIHGGLRGCGSMVLQYHPNWSLQGKNHDNISRSLDFILSQSFTKKTGISFDTNRIATWGYSYGAWFSMIEGLLDSRYTDILISHFDYLSADIVNSYSQHMSMAQLSYFENDDTPPLRVPEILTSYGDRNVLVTAGGVNVFKEYTSKITDKHPNVKVIINPYNHYITFGERKVVLDFIFNRFGINAKNRISGPAHELPKTVAEYRKFAIWDGAWRTKVLDGFKKTK